jgi:hypothetical protein
MTATAWTRRTAVVLACDDPRELDHIAAVAARRGDNFIAALARERADRLRRDDEAIGADRADQPERSAVTHDR